MNPLANKKIPAYGFESSKINASKAATSLASKIAFERGLRRTSTVRAFAVHGTSQNSITVNNIKKLAGYLPVLGAFIGIRRIHNTRKDHAIHYSRLHYIRAALEILGLGLLNAPIDIAMTKRWHRKVKHTELPQP